MRVKTAIGDLYVDDGGSGPAVLLWHSFLHHGGMWRGQIEALRAAHRVICVDAPGHGRSSATKRSYTMDDCAAAALAVLDARGVDRAAVVGLSWGGMMAMTLALRAPERVSALVLMDTSCRAESRRNRFEYRILGNIFRTLGAVPFVMRKAETLLFGPTARRTQRAMIEEWHGYVARLDRESLWHALECIFDRPDLTSDLPRVRAPTLVVVGEHDVAQPLAESKAIAAAIPGARLVVIPDAGHLSALERPAEVDDVLLPFLAEHAGKPAPVARPTRSY